MAVQVTLQPHRWERLSVEEGDVIVDPASGLPYFEPRPDSPLGEQVGCAECCEPLTKSSVLTSCRPTSIDD